MSITYCHNCNKYVDTDFDATHIEDCVEQDGLEQLKNKKLKSVPPVETYTYIARCTNCGNREKLEVPKGAIVQDYLNYRLCDYCRCNTYI